MKRRKVGIGKRILASLIALVLCAVAGEITLRLVAPFPDYSHEVIRSFPDRYDPELGYAGIPGLVQPFILPDFRVTIRNNSRGFRDRERDYAKGGKKRIVVLGDSFAWGWGVENDEIFTARMEDLMPGWEVINLAHAGYSTDQELLLLEREGLKYSPDIVLLVFCGNDVKDAHSDVIDGIQPKPYFVERDGRLVLRGVPVPFDPDYWRRKRALSRMFAPEKGAASPAGRLMRRSHLLNWIRFRLAHLRSPARGGKPAAPKGRLMKEIALNLALIGKMNALCKEHGARLVVADIPSDYSPLLGEFCRKKGIDYLDLGPALESRIHPTVFRRVGHWTPYGHRRVARALVAFLREEGLLE